MESTGDDRRDVEIAGEGNDTGPCPNGEVGKKVRGFLGATLLNVDTLRVGVDDMSELPSLGIAVDVEAELSSREGGSGVIVPGTVIISFETAPLEEDMVD